MLNRFAHRGRALHQTRMLASVLFFLCVSTQAADEGVDEAEVLLSPVAEQGQRRPLGALEQIDRWHARIADAIADPVDRVDRFFGDERIEDEDQRTRLQTGAGVRVARQGDPQLVTDFSLRLAMPRTRNRWQIFLDEATASEDLEDLDSVVRATTDYDPDVGLRYLLQQTRRASVSADAGMRFGSPTQVFGRLRGRVRFPLERSRLELTESLAQYSSDGWRSTTDLIWTRPLERDYVFRTRSRLVVEKRRDGVTPDQSLALFKTISLRRSWRLEASGNWPETPSAREIQYKVEWAYRQIVHRDWLFVELAPGVEFPQTEGYAAQPFMVLKFEVVFQKE